MDRNLDPKAEKLLGEANDVRIAHIRGDRWVTYPAAKRILDELEELMNWPTKTRPPCRLIVSESNNGKSSLIEHFGRRHPPDQNLSGASVKVPVLIAEVTSPNEKAMYRTLLEALFEKVDPKDTTEERREQLYAVLRRIQPKLILLDESNDFLAGSRLKLLECLVALKHISTKTKIPIVAVGTPEAKRAFASDPQLENRFVPIELPRWKSGPEFQGLLKSIEKTLPLRHASGLHDKMIADVIFHRTRGILGEACALVEAAATYAIRTATEKITLVELEKCNYRVSSKFDSRRSA
ncbi:TniB family NTP-binding protein [Piscinibacter sp. HJYY11]|uniref:TniB family NTP-binding protein n=1 Tax=Piscinibacter sp. HJYY11 TaxID=2801333 RepID=UPI0019202DB3|nr:TniB family NTP-binding protein [Piscinibacter sp. HJYY11]MBL0729443.1 TniB family NTP-binding protein [Piscinibacter sp. HJYY11]